LRHGDAAEVRQGLHAHGAKREKLTQERQRFTIVVDERPTRAGIDPYNKLIDRIADDNVIDVTTE
jgi:hypothetical protein